jgi:hypothetical protein
VEAVKKSGKATTGTVSSKPYFLVANSIGRVCVPVNNAEPGA